MRSLLRETGVYSLMLITFTCRCPSCNRPLRPHSCHHSPPWLRRQSSPCAYSTSSSLPPASSSSASLQQKGMFLYSVVSSLLDRSKRFTLFALPDRPGHSDTNSASPGSILVMQQLRTTTKSLTFPPLSIASYSFIKLSQQGRQWREGKCHSSKR